MKLVPFDAADLRQGEPLPVSLRDAAGRLLLAAGVVVHDRGQFESLARTALFTDELGAAEWRRRVNVAMDAKLRQNALLKEVVAARPEGPPRVRGFEGLPLALALEDGVAQLDVLLRELVPSPGAQWMFRLDAQRAHLLSLLRRRPDAALYLLVYEAGQATEKYSSHHAVLTMAVCELAAAHFRWPDTARVSLQRAALTMNVAMLRLQDQLATRDRPLTEAMTEEIAGHPAAGVTLLEKAGFSDRLALDVVLHHHACLEGRSTSLSLSPLSSPPPSFGPFVSCFFCRWGPGQRCPGGLLV